MAEASNEPRYRFGRFELQPAERRLLVAEKPVALAARDFDLLMVLVERAGHLVTKNELLERVWPSLVVEENNLAVHVATLRKLLGQEAIATVVGHGYRFALPVERRIAADSAPLAAVRHNLSAERDAFVGREVELRTLAQHLDEGARLVTVVGSGGSGKTRLIRRYGLTRLRDWPGGIYFCDLSDARGLDGIVFAVASALEVPLGEDDPVARLGHAIAGRGRCLVILDNFEQVVAHASATLGRWLDRAAEAAFVVTSRERLHLAGETLFALEPLPLDGDAIELFVARAHAQRPDFVLSEVNRAAAAEVVRLLDGLPLAIELAAARISVLSPSQLVERLKDRFRLLIGGRGVVARQATLRAAIDWSWNLLTKWEQAALAQCAVFEGGFTLESAESVLDLSAWTEAPQVIDLIEALVSKSLLRSWVPGAQGRYAIEEPYFGMYVSIHDYAREKMSAAGTDAERGVEERHGHYFARCGTDEAIETLYGRECGLRRRALALELDNIVAACRRAAERGDGATAVMTYRAAWEVLDLKGPVAFGEVLGARVLCMADLNPTQRAMVSLARARAHRRGGSTPEAQALLEQTIDLLQRSADRALEAEAHAELGKVLHRQGCIDQARAHLEVALAAQRELGNRRAEGGVLSSLGSLDVYQGRVDEGLSYFGCALAIHRELSNRIDEANVLSQIAVVLGEAGRLPEAQAYFEQSLAFSRELGDRISEGEALNNLGCLNQDLGRLNEACSLYEESLAIHREVGNRRFEGYALGDLGRLYMEQGRFADAQACLDQALAITRETVDRRIEGSELRSLGDLLAMQDRTDDARTAYVHAERVLREIGDKYYLALALCGRAELECRDGDRVLAGQAFAEAKLLAAQTRVGAHSYLGRKVAALESALA